MKSFFLLLTLLLPIQSVLAFNQLECESELKDWALIAPRMKSPKTPPQKTISLTEVESRVLIIKSASSKTVASIFPWNSLHTRLESGFKKIYELKSEESSQGFVIELIDQISKESRKLSCQFTFQ